MPKPLANLLKASASLIVFFVVWDSCTGTDFSPHIGTLGLALAASILTFFGKPLALNAKAGAYLVLVVAVSHAIDRYFWSGVWDHGYPWPYSPNVANGGGFIGSVSPFIYQVSVVSFVILLAIALAFVAWHRISTLKRKKTNEAAA